MVHYQLIAMNAEEADERGIEDLTGLESAMPGLARAVQTFFRVYKVLFLNGFLVIGFSNIPQSSGASWG